ncbi:MAG: aminomethyl-transferring glycine dehydrogenase subunit GcvPB [Bacteroidales bacterium]|nr:aminomethyl-transferring glycine dehydrogenase subunit GcvPB [Bacteroidales bacterium]MDY5459323.1 aminomethyl-transferring glycine dehydrogenase subunit GcvPB [Candidatus Cryptobacteroides sp.]MEE0340671.1 aminomethyl-transferring glycine dehydrogenase subunit GcvPB [Bacteroidales bacterium]
MKYYDKLILELSQSGRTGFSLREAHSEVQLPENLKRKTALNLPEVSEPDVVRHYTNLSQMNFGVDTGFYPLGSCTMKYNPKINEELAHIPEFTGAHPLMHSEGLEEVYRLADKYLAAITGMSHFTFQPCAGAHGELTGLMLMRAYHESRGDEKRKRIIVPDSAHGTNPASAAMCGLDVVVVKSGENGLVDVESLKPLLGDDLAGIMLTNPNTLGLFERDIKEIASLVHECGGLLYYDGANMNPLLGVVRPGDMGFDIMHLNLHKTFSTPHGGGGPGSGPVGVNEKLAGLLPTIRTSGFHGNTGVIIKALAYILSLGREHIRLAGKLATLNANYIKESLRDSYLLPIDSVCKHEFVFDGLREPNGVTTLDVAKRLLDYGFHAPTIYFPLLFHQTIMIEPTETESKETMDGFIEVMEKIAREAKEDPELLKTAPHNTPVSRPDETLAARRPILRWTPES